MKMPTDKLTRPSVTDGLDLETLLSQLARLEVVDGLALYGSRTRRAPGSDIDVLALVTQRPRDVLQLFTSVERCTTDILLVDVATYDQVLDGRRRLAAATVEAMFMIKLQTADILVDRSRRLERGRDRSRGDHQPAIRIPGFSARYLIWFGQNFNLAHLKRMAASPDGTYATAVDLMMAAGLGQACRAYCDIRQLPWEGEKRAIAYLAECDPEYLRLLRHCLASGERSDKLATYEALVARMLEPFGPIWPRDVSAVNLSVPVTEPTQIAAGLDFWEQIFTPPAPQRRS